MNNVDQILETAQERAEDMGLPYKGALLPSEAHAVLQAMPEARIIDVRCRAELDWVGRVPGAIEVELLAYPGMRPNPGFLDQLSSQIADDTVLLFICRSGGRSDQAATLMSQNGFTDCYNILEGFEGDKDKHGHRGQQSGWKAAGLPWIQG
ncbi:MAG: rhodanese-like domain-containing protein [Nitrosomonas sp.]|uniref:rhodanese-like domain-containing protein n=1 Tax=Nitrosomonas sp. TaxID=42353 RepID=UPI0025699641|nr:rhodanese-like domain-containing protein [Nitrosomonas sp.]MBE7527481.1 rhodanese-like domain-containing protein [Burkholderiales bacterium]MCC6161492.1 rhodanese-like domain-containing protein [Nitrosomonas sp.]MDL1865894.1 rhodanese-like domain-containing protein [Betaproteobacteria bacterium PRO4]